MDGLKLVDSENICFKVIRNCVDHNTVNRSLCDTCESGFDLIANKTICRKPILNCITYSDKNLTLCSLC